MSLYEVVIANDKMIVDAIFAAYDWKSDLTEEEILEKLLSLNLEREGKRG